MIQSVTRNLFSTTIAVSRFIINARAQADTTFRNSCDGMFTKQETYHISAILLNNGAQGTDHLPGKFILNANVSYEPVKGFMLYCAGKNLLNSTAREFYYTDKVPFMLMGGFSYKLP
jgi:hypothetical protein